MRDPEEARIQKLEERIDDMVDVRELRRLISRWRSRAEVFGEDDRVAERTAILCADELEELIDDE